MTTPYRKIGVGRSNTVAGENHYKATLTDHEVGLVIELFETGMSARTIAEKFEISVRTVYMYTSGERRSYASYRIISVIDKK